MKSMIRGALLAASLAAMPLGVAMPLGAAFAQPAYPPLPPPRVERVPPPPGGAYIWEPGHWQWDGVRYAWEPGHYIARRAEYRRWEPGHWAARGGAWVWVPPHWS